MIIDAHCHLYDEKMADIKDEIFKSIEAGEVGCIVSGDNVENSKKCIEIANKYKNVYATVGVHPHETKNFDDNMLGQIKSLCKNKNVVAIGEIGLDYYYDENLKSQQLLALQKQIDLAYELSLPCVFHVREAMGDFLDMVKKNKDKFRCSGLVHSFNGSVEVAKELMKFGFYFSFNGIATFKNANNVLKVIEFLPMDRILIETDSPYLAPVPHRGEINRPSYVSLVAQKIADIKKVPVDEIISQTKINTENLFGIKFE